MHANGDAETLRRLPQGCFSPIREVYSLIFNAESPKRPAHVPTLLLGSPSSGHGGAAQGTLGTRHRFGEPQLWGPNRLRQRRCSPSRPAPRPASLLPRMPPRAGVRGARSIPTLPASSEGPEQGNTPQKQG